MYAAAHAPAAPAPAEFMEVPSGLPYELDGVSSHNIRYGVFQVGNDLICVAISRHPRAQPDVPWKATGVSFIESTILIQAKVHDVLEEKGIDPQRVRAPVDMEQHEALLKKLSTARIQTN